MVGNNVELIEVHSRNSFGGHGTHLGSAEGAGDVFLVRLSSDSNFLAHILGRGCLFSFDFLHDGVVTATAPAWNFGCGGAALHLSCDHCAPEVRVRLNDKTKGGVIPSEWHSFLDTSVENRQGRFELLELADGFEFMWSFEFRGTCRATRWWCGIESELLVQRRLVRSQAGALSRSLCRA
jgi:hypothetical protein